MTHLRAIQSSSASIRLKEARAFLDQFLPGDEVLLLGASRGAVDDLARSIAIEKGATLDSIVCRSRSSPLGSPRPSWLLAAKHRPRGSVMKQ